MPSFTLRYQDFGLETIPSDTVISIQLYLADTAGVPVINSDGTLDIFDVITQKSKLPVSGYVAFLSDLARISINEKFNFTTTAQLVAGSPIVTGLTTTSGIVPGLVVSGTGIKADTTVQVIRSTTSVQLSSSATVNDSVSLGFSNQGWIIDYSIMNYFGTVINFGSI